VQNNPINRVDPTGMVDEEPQQVKKIDPVDNPQIRNNRASNLDIPSRVNEKGEKYTHSGFDYHDSVGTDIKTINSGKIIDVHIPKGNAIKTSYGISLTVAHYKKSLNFSLSSVLDENGKTNIKTSINEIDVIDYYSFYAHLKSVSVKQGDYVKQGQTIGLLGKTGNAWDQPAKDDHLHFEVGSSVKYTPAGRLIISDRFSPNKVVKTMFFKDGDLSTNISSVISLEFNGNNLVKKQWPININSNPNFDRLELVFKNYIDLKTIKTLNIK